MRALGEAPRVAIAGATGFVGRALWARLAPKYSLLGLSRGVPGAPEVAEGETTVWRSCNLFNLLQVERALQGADVAFYLVHSMLPSARLAQGRFEDMDLLCADNFGCAAARAGVKQIVYLGGLIPPHPKLSTHLRSRLEVEAALAGHGVPVTTLRAGIVLGPEGSSSEMLLRLVRRLPVMVAPRWVRSRTQPIALSDVLDLLEYALAHPEPTSASYDVGCPEVVTYAELLRRAGALHGRRVRILMVPVRTLKLSLLWVSLITQTPRQLVLPLVESLQHDMVARDGLVFQRRAGLAAQPLTQALAQALPPGRRAPRSARATVPRTQVRADAYVTSVQRMPLPPGYDAARVVALYVRWLRRFLRPLMRIDIGPNRATHRFFLPGVRRPLLELTLAPRRSSPIRQLYYVTGGLLARTQVGAQTLRAVAAPKAPEGAHAEGGSLGPPAGIPPGTGRFEFRCVPGRPWVLAAVHDFAPRLPWYLYVGTQALVHAWVMHRFGRVLARLARRRARRQPSG